MNKITKLIRSVLIPGCLSVVLFMCAGTATFAKAAGDSLSAPKQELSGNFLIVALGDSISAGYEPGMNEKSIPYGFVERLEEQGLFYGRTHSRNYGILGLTSEGLRNYVAAVRSGASVTPDGIQSDLPDPRISSMVQKLGEVKSAITQADLITITIGGNDLMRLLPEVNALRPEELTEQSLQVLAGYENNTRAVISELLAMNPDVQIILSDQYQPVPKVVGTKIYATLQHTAESYTAAVDRIAADFSAKGYRVQEAHIAAEFIGREIELTHIFPSGDIHPNQFGYELIAKSMAERIWGAYQVPSVRFGAVPVSVVVKGKEIQSPSPPILKNNRTFVALKDITNAVGGTAEWNSHTETATVTYGDRKVKIKVGSPIVTANGVAKRTDAPAFLSKVGKENKTYIPLAMLVQGLGLDVRFSNHMKTVFINL